MRRSIALPGIIAVLAFAGPALAEEGEQEVPLQDIPAVVRATVEAQAAGAKIVEAELEQENGVKVYSIETKAADGKEVEYTVAPDGKLLKTENEDGDADDDDKDEQEQKLDLATAPEAVRSAITALLKGTMPKALTQEKENGAMVYEAEYELDGVQHSIELAANGSVLEQEATVTSGSLPPEVAAAVEKAYPGAQINLAEEVTVRYYEIKITAGGKKREVKVSPAGKLHKGDDDDDDEDDDN